MEKSRKAPRRYRSAARLPLFVTPRCRLNLGNLGTYNLARVLRYAPVMKDLSVGEKHTFELIGLLQEIITTFDDGNSRPAEKIALYERYRELQKTHPVKLVGRFIVISGHGKKRRRRSRFHTQARYRARLLRLAERAKARESMAAFSTSGT